MIIKGIIDEDFTNYKKPSMLIAFPYCTFKCGQQVCQNSTLAASPNITIEPKKIIERYLNNSLTTSILFQGLEPLDSLSDVLSFLQEFRKISSDPIVIYTGYNKDEIPDIITKLTQYKNIIVKFGRYIPNQKPHYDPVLGVNLISDNQYAEQIS